MIRRTFLFLFFAAWLETEAETLSGKKVTLPAVFGGKPAVVVWSFSKAAGEKSTAWLGSLHKEGFNAWGAAMLEAAPRFVRPMIRGGMRKDMSAALQDRQLLLYRDEKAWRARLSVKDEALPLVVVLDAAGNVAWTQAALFDQQTLSEVKRRLDSPAH